MDDKEKAGEKPGKATLPEGTEVAPVVAEATEATVATQDDLIKLESSIMARLDTMLSQYFQAKDKLALTNSAGIAVPNPVPFVKASAITTEPGKELLADSGLPTTGLGATPMGASPNNAIPIADDGGPKPQNGGEGISKDYSALPPAILIC